MLRALLATRNDWYLTLPRLAAGVMILPHGLQKTFGWFGGPGFSKMMAGFTQGAHIPTVFAFLAIMAEFLGGIGLIAGFLTRIAAFGVLVNMVVAIAILLGVMLRGAGPASIDRVIAKE